MTFAAKSLLHTNKPIVVMEIALDAGTLYFSNHDAEFGGAEVIETLYSSIKDGYVLYSSASDTFAVVRAGTTGTSVNDSSVSYVGGAGYVHRDDFMATMAIGRGFFYFDLLGLAADKIAGAKLSLYKYDHGDSSASVQQGTQAGTLTTADYNNFTGSEFGHTSWAGSGYIDIDFDAAGIAYIQTLIGSGTAKLCAREYEHDYSNSEPGTPESYFNGCFFSDEAGTTKNPKLTLTYNDARFYEGRVLSFGSLSRSVSNVEGDFEISDIKTIFSDADGYFKALNQDLFLNRVVTYKIGFEDDGISDFKTIFVGAISDFSYDEATFSITVKDITSNYMERDYGGILSSTDFPNANDDIINKKMPIVYGEHTNPTKATSIDRIGTSKDGNIYHNDALWANVYGAATGTGADDTQTGSYYATEAKKFAGGNYMAQRSFFYFDLSGVSGILIATAVSLSLFKSLNGDSSVSVQQGTQASTLTTADYDAFTGTKFGHTSWAGSGYIDIDFDAAGIAYVQTLIGSGTAKLCAREYEHDYSNSAPGDGIDYSNGLIYSEGSADEVPLLKITYTSGVGVIPCYLIDPTKDKWLVAGHAMSAINDVFIPFDDAESEPRLVDSANYTIALTETYANGLDADITTVTFDADAPPANAVVTVNGDGITDGGLLQNPIDIIKHFITEYLSMTTSQYNATDFTAQTTIATNRSYIGAGIISDFSKRPLEHIEEIARSFGLTVFFDEDGLFTLKFVN